VRTDPVWGTAWSGPVSPEGRTGPGPGLAVWDWTGLVWTSPNGIIFINFKVDQKLQKWDSNPCNLNPDTTSLHNNHPLRALTTNPPVTVSGQRLCSICSLNLRVPQWWVGTIWRVGGEDLIFLSILSHRRRDRCFIYTRRTNVLWRNHCEDALHMVNGYVSGEWHILYESTWRLRWSVTTLQCIPAASCWHGICPSGFCGVWPKAAGMRPLACGPHGPPPAPIPRSRSSPGSDARHQSPDVVLGFAKYTLFFPIYSCLSFSLFALQTITCVR